MNILSLFDGMSCGQIALNRLGIKYDNYYASEIDKHAIKITQHNYPGTIQLGDVTQVHAKDLPKIDLILAGSPCQGFSFAGKGLAFDDPRSKLFFEFVRILNEVREINPDAKYLLENVKMKQEHETVISRILNINPIEINSALVSAQNRVRLYWTNIECKPVGLFGDLECVIPQPKDKGVLLRDVLEKDVDEKYYISEAAINRINRKEYSAPQVNPEKTGSLNTKNNSGQLSVDSGTTLIIDVEGRSKLNQNKSSCFTAGGNSGGNHSDMDLIVCVASCGRDPENQSARIPGQNNVQTLEQRNDFKTNCLTSVQKDNLVMQINPSKESGNQQPYQQNRIYHSDGISPALQAQLSTGSNAILHNARIRRLTPIECERFQTVPDNYTSCVSDTRRYHALGNGWTVDVICHILSYM